MDLLVSLYAGSIALSVSGALCATFNRLGPAVLFYTLFTIVAYVTYEELLSRPKHIDSEWAHAQADKAAVLGSQIREGDGIYVYLQLPGVVEPRSYKLPWDQKLAEQLQKAQREAQANGGGGVLMEMPFEPSWDNQPKKFYAPPQPARPEKPGQGSGSPQMVERQEV